MAEGRNDLAALRPSVERRAEDVRTPRRALEGCSDRGAHHLVDGGAGSLGGKRPKGCSLSPINPISTMTRDLFRTLLVEGPSSTTGGSNRE